MIFTFFNFPTIPNFAWPIFWILRLIRLTVSMRFLIRSLHIPCAAENKNQIPSIWSILAKKERKRWPRRAILSINIGFYLKQPWTLEDNIRTCVCFTSNSTLKTTPPFWGLISWFEGALWDLDLVALSGAPCSSKRAVPPASLPCESRQSESHPAICRGFIFSHKWMSKQVVPRNLG